MTKFLIENNADVHIVNKKGCNALNAASESELRILLFSAGAKNANITVELKYEPLKKLKMSKISEKIRVVERLISQQRNKELLEITNGSNDDSIIDRKDG